MTKELANLLIENWNGKDKYFICDGEIRSEDDVHEAHYTLTKLKQ